MTSKEYLEKLKDPRWQKKRLEIFERDGWCCAECTRLDATLHVHHKIYSPGVDPWEIPNDCLVTLCEDCHVFEKLKMQEALQGLNEILKKLYLSRSIIELSLIFSCIPQEHASSVIEELYLFYGKRNWKKDK